MTEYKFKGRLETETFTKKTEHEPTFAEWVAYVQDALKNGKAVFIHRPKPNFTKGTNDRNI